MIPANCCRTVTPIKSHTVGYAKGIATRINREINSVSIVDFKIQFGVQVIKVQGIAVNRRVRNQFQQHIDVGSACRKQERSAIFDYRTFHCQPRCNQADSSIHTKVLIVTIFHSYIHYRRDSSAIFGRCRSFVKCDVLYRITVES